MSDSGAAFAWRPAHDGDVDAICAIAAQIHPALPERREVFEEKIALFPLGCFIFETGGTATGYALSHPFRLGEAPALDAFLLRLPQTPDCHFIHDVAVLPAARGRLAAPRFLDLAVAVARRQRFGALALISVYGTAPLWRRYGFAEAAGPAKLASYGGDAHYMLRRIAADGT